MTTKPVLTKTAGKLNTVSSRIAPYAPTDGVVKLLDDGMNPLAAWYSIKTGDAAINVGHKYVNMPIDDDQLAADVESAANYGYFNEYKDTPAAVRKLIGLVQHELAHCRWSRWLLDPKIMRKSTQPQYVMATHFEEIRIEKRVVDSTHGRARPTLRSSFEIVLDSIADAAPTNKADIATAWLLAVGRAYATVATQEEVRAVDDVARIVLGDETVDTLHELLDEAVMLDIDSVDSPGYARLIEIADEWISLVGVTTDDSSMTESYDVRPGDVGADAEDGKKIKVASSPADKSDDDNNDDNDDSNKAAGDKTDDADDADEATDDETGDGDASDQDAAAKEGRGGKGKFDGMDDATDETDQTLDELSPEEADLLRKTLSKIADDIARDWAVQPKIKLADPRETSVDVFTKKRKRKFHTRQPLPSERKAAVDLARRIEAFSYTAPDVAKVRSLVPPGRLNTRDALRASAERKRGMMVTAKPWEGKRRRHVHNPPITVGLMTDVSGSMGWAEQLVAATSFVFSKAMTRVSGRYAAVTFGDKVEPIVWPNEIINEVRVRSATGSSEDFDHGVAALDGILKLTTGKGVRLLVIVSDGHFVRRHEPDKAYQWYDKMTAAGVGIVWINGYTPRGAVAKNAEIAIVDGVDVTTMIAPIASAMERAIAAQRF